MERTVVSKSSAFFRRRRHHQRHSDTTDQEYGGDVCGNSRMELDSGDKNINGRSLRPNILTETESSSQTRTATFSHSRLAVMLFVSVLVAEQKYATSIIMNVTQDDVCIEDDKQLHDTSRVLWGDSDENQEKNDGSNVSSASWSIENSDCSCEDNPCMWFSAHIPFVQHPSSPLISSHVDKWDHANDADKTEEEEDAYDQDDEYYLDVNFEPDYNDLELFHYYDEKDDEYFYTYYPSWNEDDDDNFHRMIYYYEDRDYEAERSRLLFEIDDPYFDDMKYSPDESIQDKLGTPDSASDLDSNFDDDDDSEDDESRYCRRNSWKRTLFVNCNAFHEVPFELQPAKNDSLDNNADVGSGSDTPFYEASYLGSGHFRDAFLYQQPYILDGDTSERFVYKVLRYDDEFHVDHQDMERVQKEAIIMERLTGSPRIINTYGYCSTSIMTEAMQKSIWQQVVPGEGQMSQSKLDEIQDSYTDGTDVHPFNNYTTVEKLTMAIKMAEAIADVHGYEHGVIVHGDVHPEQWLLDYEGEIRLNDFNNAEILDYNVNDEDYCGSFRKFGGAFRAPEEYVGSYIDESVDIFSMGNNIYCLITGLWPFYEWTSYTDIQRKLLNHERAYIDPRYRTRSFIESKLVEIMERTWEFEPENRVSIFEVVEFLRDVAKGNERREQLGLV